MTIIRKTEWKTVVEKKLLLGPKSDLSAVGSILLSAHFKTLQENRTGGC